MSVPSRQIGWGTEENLLWEISKQIEQLIGVANAVTSPSTKIVLAKLSSPQTLSSGSDTAINYTSTDDVNGWFNNTTHVFQPTVAGYYNISYSVLWQNVAGGTGQINTQINKNNGTQIFIQQTQLNTADPQTHTSSTVVYMNGTTDNIKITGYTSSTTGNQVINSGAGTLFTAFLI